MHMSNSTDNPQEEKNIKHMKIGNTTYKITSIHKEDISFLDLIKNALKREADAFLRQVDE